MTVIRNNSISGINSITAQSNSLQFYDSAGNTLAISADVTGGVTVATGATISGSTNTITASTNGSERVRINSSGNIGIGTDNPAVNLQVKGSASNAQIYLGGTGAHSQIYADNDGVLILSADQGNTAASSYFAVAVDNTERARVTSGGNVQIANGNLVFSTSGTGIDFSANSNAAGMTSELLDDYEEGTWTPTFTGPGATFTYSSQHGSYIKIGTLVYAALFVQISAVSGGSGTCGIGGLPFTTGNSASNPNPGGYIQLVGNWNTNHPDSLEATGASTTQLNLLYRTAANGTNNQAVPTSNFQANTFVRATIVYFSS